MTLEPMKVGSQRSSQEVKSQEVKSQEEEADDGEHPWWKSLWIGLSSVLRHIQSRFSTLCHILG